MSLTILFNTYPVAFDCPGGGEVQLIKYMEALSQAGVRVLRYDIWNPRFAEADIVHYFSVQGGSWRFCTHVRDVCRIPLVISPIIWIDKPEKYGMEEIGSTLRMATRILPNSKLECQQLSSFFGLEPSLLTPIVNGVDDVFFEAISPIVPIPQ